MLIDFGINGRTWKLDVCMYRKLAVQTFLSIGTNMLLAFGG